MGGVREISWKQNLFFIWVGQILAMAGTSLALPFIPLYLREHFGVVDEAERAVAVSLFYAFGMLSFCVFNPVWGAVGDRFGRKLMLLRAYLVTGLIFPLMMFAPSIAWLIAIRFIASIFSGTVSAAQALTAATTPDEHQGFALGTLSTAFWSGNMIGLVGGGVIVHYCGYATAFVVCGALFIAGGILTIFFVHENFVPPVRTPHPAGTPRRLLHLPDFELGVWLLLGMFFAFALARRCDEPFLALLVEMVAGLENAALDTGIVSALAAVGGILSGMFFGAMSDRLAPAKLAVPALAAAGAFMLGQAAAQHLWVLAGARFLTYFAAGGLEPIFLSLLSRTTKPEKRGMAFGWSASSRVLGSLVGALLGGALVALFGTRGVFVAGGVLMVLLIPLVLAILRVVAPNRP